MSACPHVLFLSLPVESQIKHIYACVHLCTHRFITTYHAHVRVIVVLANSKYLLLGVAAANSGLAINRRRTMPQRHLHAYAMMINMKYKHIHNFRNCTQLHTSACVHTQTQTQTQTRTRAHTHTLTLTVTCEHTQMSLCTLTYTRTHKMHATKR